MSEDYKVQVSIKFGPNLVGMLNIRANSVAELDLLINETRETTTPALMGFTEELGALSAIQGQFPQAQVIGSTSGSGGGQNTGAPNCNHGPMTYRTGGSGSDRWEGHFCPQPKGAPDKCKPIYPRK